MGLDPRDDDDEVISPDPDYLSTAQAAALLGGVSTQFVVAEILSGRLSAKNLGLPDNDEKGRPHVNVIRRDGLRTVYRVTDKALHAYQQKYNWTWRPPAA